MPRHLLAFLAVTRERSWGFGVGAHYTERLTELKQANACSVLGPRFDEFKAELEALTELRTQSAGEPQRNDRSWHLADSALTLTPVRKALKSGQAQAH